MVDLTIDNILLYAQCPMRYYLSSFLGIDEYSSTFRGQLEDVIRTSLYSYIGRAGDINAVSVTSRIFNNLSSKIQIPSESRGSPRKKEGYKEAILIAAEKVRYAAGAIHDMLAEYPADRKSVVGSPYIFDLDILGTIVTSRFDALIQLGDTYHVIMFDLNQSYPSDEYLNTGIRLSTAAYAFRYMYRATKPYKLVHFNIYNTSYMEVDRTDAQIRSVGYELSSMVKAQEAAVTNNQWYRSKSQICNSCYAKIPCEEIFTRLALI
jgi:hypothetical protein